MFLSLAKIHFDMSILLAFNEMWRTSLHMPSFQFRMNLVFSSTNQTSCCQENEFNSFCHFVQKSPNGGFNIQLQEKKLFGLQKQTSLEVSSLQSNFVRIIGAGLLFMWWKDNLIVNNFPFYYLSSQISPFSCIFFLAPS